MKVAESVEKQLNDLFGYDEPKARLYGVALDASTKEPVLGTRLDGSDIYQLLASAKARRLASKSEFVAVITCGWAAPINPDGDNDDEPKPSEHPKRRRVRLVIVAHSARNRKSVASVLRFGDTPNETVTDEGKAQGNLADAVSDLFA
jgi:hypothetical protein